ncbi:MAG: response regulator GspIIEN [Geobacteraceae bacterium]|nr:MAG: response regulator GspIIEN [Geobacteraceae bacterium]
MSDRKQLGDLLVEAGIITVKTLERALARQKGSGKRLGTILEEMGVITEEELVEALAKQFNFKTVMNIVSYPFSRELLDVIPEDLAVEKLIFPLQHKERMLAVAVTDPFDTETLDYLAKQKDLKIIPVLATRKDILAAIEKHYLHGKAREHTLSKILVVEDSSPVAIIIKVALEKEGYEVEIGHDGLEGLKLAIHQKPDLIICDSVMPRMDGFGLMRALKANTATAHIPIILLTSKASGEEEQKALESGFLDFIAKPVQPIRVVSRVKRAFDLLKRMKS